MLSYIFIPNQTASTSVLSVLRLSIFSFLLNVLNFDAGLTIVLFNFSLTILLYHTKILSLLATSIPIGYILRDSLILFSHLILNNLVFLLYYEVNLRVLHYGHFRFLLLFNFLNLNFKNVILAVHTFNSFFSNV